MREQLALIVGGRGGIGAVVTRAFEVAGWRTFVAGRADDDWPDFPAVIVNATGAGMRSTSRGDLATLADTNVDVAERAGHQATAARARLVHLGTPLQRTPLLELGDPYVATKARASALLHEIPDLDLVELRPHLVVGTPGCLVTRIADSLRAGVPFGLRTPQALRDVVHVDDVARAVLLAATVTATTDEPLEIGAGQAVTMAELATMIAGLLGTDTGWVKEPGQVQVWDGYLVADPEPAARALGFHAELTVGEAVRRCLEHRAERSLA